MPAYGFPPSGGMLVPGPLPPAQLPAGLQAATPAGYPGAWSAGMPRPVYALDVECVATGPKHDDRAVAQVRSLQQTQQQHSQATTASSSS